MSLALLVSGCGSDRPELATVNGTVVLNGERVPGGRVMFTPIAEGDSINAAGRPATGLVDSLGSFELMTYGPGDGVVVAQHAVVYYQPEGEDEEERAAIDPFFKGKTLYVPANARQTVEPGANEVLIEIFDASNKAK